MSERKIVSDWSQTCLRSKVESEKNTNIVPLKCQTYPFEMLLHPPSKLKRIKFFQDIGVGELVIGIINGLYENRIEMTLLCTIGNVTRSLHDLHIDATCGVKDLPQNSKYSSLRSFRSRDRVKAVITKINPNHTIDVTMNRLKVTNEYSVELGLISKEEIPDFVRPIIPINFFTDTLKSNTLQANCNIRDRIRTLSFSPHGFSLLDSVNKITISSHETGRALRDTQLEKESRKFLVRGIDYYKARKYTEAQTCYNHALNMFPNNVDALVARGALYASLKSYESAIEDFSKAVQLDPRHKNATDYLESTRIAAAAATVRQNVLSPTSIVVPAAVKTVNQTRRKERGPDVNSFIVEDDDDDDDDNDGTNSSSSSSSPSHKKRKRKFKKVKRQKTKNRKRKRSLSSPSSLSTKRIKLSELPQIAMQQPQPITRAYVHYRPSTMCSDRPSYVHPTAPPEKPSYVFSGADLAGMARMRSELNDEKEKCTANEPANPLLIKATDNIRQIEEFMKSLQKR